MKCECGGHTLVSSTVQRPDGVLRRRKCAACARNFATMEYEVSTPGAGAHNHVRKAKAKTRAKPKTQAVPKPDAQGLYTKPDAAEIKKQRVELRRKAEDRRMRVPNYFIEEDD